MKLRAWRLVEKRYARTAFDGEGARRYGGRWNSRGVAVVYTSQSQSLAALELLANAESATLLDRFLFFPVEFDNPLVEAVGLRSLPKNWQANPAPPELKEIGNAWVRSRRSCVLQVPSAVLPSESNFLLNPAHADFGRLIIGGPVRFRFDPRLRRQS